MMSTGTPESGSPMHVVGYLDRMSATAGTSVSCMISSSVGDVTVDIVRLIHGDTNPAGPGMKVETLSDVAPRVVPGRVQDVFRGSCIVAHGVGPVSTRGLSIHLLVQPTLARAGHEQGILSLVDKSADPVMALVITPEGGLALRGRSSDALICGAAIGWRARAWYEIKLDLGIDSSAQLACEQLGVRATTGVVMAQGTFEEAVVEGVVIGAVGCARVHDQWQPRACFNGKIENPVLTARESASGEWSVLADWRFEREMSGVACADAGPLEHHGVLVNSPMRACTGHNWTGRTLNPADAPKEYGAIHFHDDDLEDAEWQVDAVLELPEGLRSGVYAVRLMAGDEVDHIPFAVTPRPGGQRARTLLLLPTFTYVAYANERMMDRLDLEGDGIIGHTITPGPHDLELARHPEWGLSLYDIHSDGTGCCYSSHLRPVPNLRPDYRDWMQDAPRHLSADLYLVDWLEHQGVLFDVITDHDLNDAGPELLADYDLILTGSHPEYYGERMLEALEQHLVGGGSLMYLGGNGFYWVTSQAPGRPHLIEVRRGASGTRPWEGAPGENYHSTTGEPGGLWRHRGHPPNALVGVGMTSQGWDEKAPGYRRLPDSFTPAATFVFAGIDDDETIGDFGLIMNGSSGDEIDRFDVSKGSPEDALVLARSTGHSDYYKLAGEDVLYTRANLGGCVCGLVRSDMILIERPEGGAVFSVGSICFTGALSHNNCANNVSTIIANVIGNFLARPGKSSAGE